jgi:acetoin:2,6-dichlorophenolindophenol oxidoreductase subunit alpha
MMTNAPPGPSGVPLAGGSSGTGDMTIEQATRLAMFRGMLEIRLVEQGAFDLFLQGMVKGTSHLAHGQEAIAVGFAAAMRADDYTFCTYRGHHHTLARGVPFELVLGELMQRAGGLNGGKGGSMHLTSVDHGVMGSYAIVGAHLPVACGAGWSAQLRGSGQVATCFFGDGTTNIGAFHEALNIAALWKLPVVFVCENNQYMEYTPIRAVTSVPFPAADRACAYGLDRIIIDGNDVDECHVAAHAAYRRARAGEGPSLIEAETYRHGGHSRADPATYRPPAEVQEWLRKDPIPRYRQRLLEIGVGEATLATIEHEVRASVKAAVEAAKAMPMADPAVVERDLWADGGVAWRS